MAQDTYIFLPEIRPFPEGRGPKGELTRQEFETLTRAGIVLFTDNTNRTSGKTPIPHQFPYYQRFGNGTDELRYPNVTLAVARGLPGTYPVTTQHWYDPEKGLTREKGRWTDDDIDECRKVLREDFEIIRTAIIDATIDPSRTEPLKIYMPGGGEGFFNTEISAISQERTPKIYAYLKAQLETLHALPRVLQAVYNLGVPVEDIRAMLPEVSHGRLTAGAAAAMTSDEVLREACVWIPKNTVADREKYINALESKVVESVSAVANAVSLSDIRLAPNTKIDLSHLSLEYIAPVNDGSIQAVLQYAFSDAEGAVTLVGKDVNDHTVDVRTELSNPDIVVFDEAALSAALLSQENKVLKDQGRQPEQSVNEPTASQTEANRQQSPTRAERAPLRKIIETEYAEASKKIAEGIKPINNLTIIPAKEVMAYAKEHGAVDTLRHPDSWPPLSDGTQVHFGNPVSHEAERMAGASIKAHSVEEASAGYLEWLIGAKHLDVEPLRRRWIINGIFSGRLYGREFVYYTDTIPTPKEGADWEPGYDGEKMYSMEYAPNHAHILLYLVNHPDKLAEMMNNVSEMRNTPVDLKKASKWFNSLAPKEMETVLHSMGNLRQDAFTKEAAAIVRERFEEQVVSMLDEGGKGAFYQAVFNALPDVTKADLYNQHSINQYCAIDCRYWTKNQYLRHKEEKTKAQEAKAAPAEQKINYREPNQPTELSDVERDLQVNRSTLEGYTIITSGAKGAEKALADAVAFNGATVIDNIAAVNVDGTLKPSIPESDRPEATRIATLAAQRLYGYQTVDHTGAERSITNENILRHYCILKDADALYAVGQIGRAGEPFYPGLKDCRINCAVDTVTGTTGYAVEMATLMEKPVYVYNQGGSMGNGWFLYNPEIKAFESIPETPKLTPHAAFIGDHFVTKQGESEIRDLVNSTMDGTKRVQPATAHKKETEVDRDASRELIVSLWFKDLSFSQKKAALTSIRWENSPVDALKNLRAITDGILAKKYDTAESEASLNEAFASLLPFEKAFAYENVNRKYNAFRVAANNIRDYINDNLSEIDDSAKVKEVTIATGSQLAKLESTGAILLETVQSPFVPLGGLSGNTKEEQAKFYEAWLTSPSPAARELQDKILRGDFIGVDVAVTSLGITDGSYGRRKRFSYPNAPLPEQIFKHFAENPEALAAIINESEPLWLARTPDVAAAMALAVEADILNEQDAAIVSSTAKAPELFLQLSPDGKRLLFSRESFVTALANTIAAGPEGLSDNDKEIVQTASASGQYISYDDMAELSDDGWKALIGNNKALSDAIDITPDVRFYALSEEGRDAVMSASPAVDAVEIGMTASARRALSQHRHDDVVVKPEYQIQSARAHGVISFAGYGQNLDSPFRSKVGYEGWTQEQLIDETMKWLCMEDHKDVMPQRRIELLSSIMNFRFVGKTFAASPTMAPYAQWFLNLVNDPTELADRLSVSLLSKERPEAMRAIIGDIFPVRTIKMDDIDMRQEAVRWFSALSPADKSTVLRQFTFEGKNYISKDGEHDYTLLSTVLSRWTDRLDYVKVTEFQNYLNTLPSEKRDAFVARYRAVEKKRGTKTPKEALVIDGTALDANRLIPIIDNIVFDINAQAPTAGFDANEKALVAKMAESIKKNISRWPDLPEKDKISAVQSLMSKMSADVRAEVGSRFSLKKKSEKENASVSLREDAVLALLDAGFSGKMNDEWLSASNDIKDIVSSFVQTRVRGWNLLSGKERIETLRKLGMDISPEAMSRISGVKMKTLPSEVVLKEEKAGPESEEPQYRAVHSHFPAALVKEFEGLDDKERVKLFEEWFHGKRPEIAPDLLKTMHAELMYGRAYDDIVVPEYDHNETLTPEGRLHQLLLHPEKVVDVVSKNPVLYSTYKKDLGKILSGIVQDNSDIISEPQRLKLKKAIEAGEHSERVLFNEVLSNTSRRAIIKAFPLVSRERLAEGQAVNKVPDNDLYMALFESLSPETETSMMKSFAKAIRSETQEHRRLIEIEAFQELSLTQKRDVISALLEQFGSHRMVGTSFFEDKDPHIYMNELIGDEPVKRNVDFANELINRYIEEKYLSSHEEFQFMKGEDGTGVYRNMLTGEVYTLQSELLHALKKTERQQAELAADSASSLETMAGDAPEFDNENEPMLAEDHVDESVATDPASRDGADAGTLSDTESLDEEEGAERLLNDEDRRILNQSGVDWSSIEVMKAEAEAEHLQARRVYNIVESKVFSDLMAKLPVDMLEKARRIGLDWDARWAAKTQQERYDLLDYFANNDSARDGRIESETDAAAIRKMFDSSEFQNASIDLRAAMVDDVFKALSNDSIGLVLDRAEQRALYEAHFEHLSVRQKYIILESSFTSLSKADKAVLTPIVDKSSGALLYKTDMELDAIFSEAFKNLSVAGKKKVINRENSLKVVTADLSSVYQPVVAVPMGRRDTTTAFQFLKNIPPALAAEDGQPTRTLVMDCRNQNEKSRSSMPGEELKTHCSRTGMDYWDAAFAFSKTEGDAYQKSFDRLVKAVESGKRVVLVTGSDNPLWNDTTFTVMQELSRQGIECAHVSGDHHVESQDAMILKFLKRKENYILASGATKDIHFTVNWEEVEGLKKKVFRFETGPNVTFVKDRKDDVYRLFSKENANYSDANHQTAPEFHEHTGKTRCQMITAAAESCAIGITFSTNTMKNRNNVLAENLCRDIAWFNVNLPNKKDLLNGDNEGIYDQENATAEGKAAERGEPSAEEIINISIEKKVDKLISDHSFSVSRFNTAPGEPLRIFLVGATGHELTYRLSQGKVSRSEASADVYDTGSYYMDILDQVSLSDYQAYADKFVEILVNKLSGRDKANSVKSYWDDTDAVDSTAVKFVTFEENFDSFQYMLCDALQKYSVKYNDVSVLPEINTTDRHEVTVIDAKTQEAKLVSSRALSWNPFFLNNQLGIDKEQQRKEFVTREYDIHRALLTRGGDPVAQRRAKVMDVLFYMGFSPKDAFEYVYRNINEDGPVSDAVITEAIKTMNRNVGKGANFLCPPDCSRKAIFEISQKYENLDGEQTASLLHTELSGRGVDFETIGRIHASVALINDSQFGFDSVNDFDAKVAAIVEYEKTVGKLLCNKDDVTQFTSSADETTKATIRGLSVYGMPEALAQASSTLLAITKAYPGLDGERLANVLNKTVDYLRFGGDRRLRTCDEVYDFFIKMNASRAISMPEVITSAAVADAFAATERYEGKELVIPTNRPAPECVAVLIRLFGHGGTNLLMENYPRFNQRTGIILNSPEAIKAFIESEDAGPVTAAYMNNKLSEEDLTNAFIAEGKRIYESAFSKGIGVIYPGDGKYPEALTENRSRTFSVEKSYQAHRRIRKGGGEAEAYELVTTEDTSSVRLTSTSESASATEAALAAIIREAQANTYGHITIADINTPEGRDMIKSADESKSMVIIEVAPYKGNDADELRQKIEACGGLVLNPNKLGEAAGKAVWIIGKQHGRANADNRIISAFLNAQTEVVPVQEAVANANLMSTLGNTPGRRHTVVQQKEFAPAMIAYRGNLNLLNNKESMGTIAILSELRISMNPNNNPVGLAAARAVVESVASQHERMTIAASLNSASGHAAIEAALQRHIPVIAVTANPLGGTADKTLISRIVDAGGLVLSEADVLGISDKDILLGRSMDLLTSVSSAAVVVESLRPSDRHLSASRRQYMEPGEVLAGYHGHVAVVSYGEQRAADLCKAFLSVEDGQDVDYNGLVEALRHNGLFTDTMKTALREDGFRLLARQMAGLHSYADGEAYAGATSLLKAPNTSIISASGEGMDDIFTKMKNTAPEEYIGRRYLMDRVDDIVDNVNMQLDPPHLRFQVFRKDEFEVFVVPTRYEVVREAVRRKYGDDAVFVSYPGEAKKYIEKMTVPELTKDAYTARILPQKPSESLLVYTRMGHGQVFGYENAPDYLKSEGLSATEDAVTNEKDFRELADAVKQYMQTLYTAAGYAGSDTIACRNACWAKVEDRMVSVYQGEKLLATIGLDNKNRLVMKNIDDLFLGSTEHLEGITRPVLITRKDDNGRTMVEMNKQRLFEILLSSESQDEQYHHSATSLEETQEYLLASREEREEMKKQLDESNESALMLTLKNVEAFRDDVSEALAAGVITNEHPAETEDSAKLKAHAFAALSAAKASALGELDKANKAVISAEGSLDILRTSVDEFSINASDRMAAEDGEGEINKAKIEAAQALVSANKDVVKAINNRVGAISAAMRAVAMSKQIREDGVVEEFENTNLRLRDYTSIYNQTQGHLRSLLVKVNEDINAMNASYETGVAYILADKYNVKKTDKSPVSDVAVENGEQKTLSAKKEWLDGQIRVLTDIKEDVENMLGTISQNPITSIKDEKAIAALRSVMDAMPRVLERSKMAYGTMDMKLSSLISVSDSVSALSKLLIQLEPGLKAATMEDLVSMKGELPLVRGTVETAMKQWPHKGIAGPMEAAVRAINSAFDTINSITDSKEYEEAINLLTSASPEAVDFLKNATIAELHTEGFKEVAMTRPDVEALGADTVQALSDKLDALVKLIDSKHLKNDVEVLEKTLVKASETARSFNRHFDIAAGIESLAKKVVSYVSEKAPILGEGKRKTIMHQVVAVDGSIRITLPAVNVSDKDLEKAAEDIKAMKASIAERKKMIADRVSSIESPYNVSKTLSSEVRHEVAGNYVVLLDTCTDKSDNVYIAITRGKDGQKGQTYVRKTENGYVPVCGDAVFVSVRKFSTLGGMVMFPDGKYNIVCHDGTFACPFNLDEIAKTKDQIFCREQSRPFITVKLDGKYNLLDFNSGSMVGEWTGTPRTVVYNEKTKMFEVYSVDKEKVLELPEVLKRKNEQKPYTPKP